MFCLPLVSFFKAIGEFRKTLRELKCSLRHLREILSGVLRITQDIEDLTSEIKGVVEFYAGESKEAVRGQLTDLISLEAQEELYYKDFIKYYQHLLSSELSQFLYVHNHTKQAFKVAIEMLQKLRYTINMMKLALYGDVAKITVLVKIDESVYQMHQNHQRDLLEQEHNQSDECDQEDPEKLDIRLFCDKQKALGLLEGTLTKYLNVYLPNENGNDDNEFDQNRHTRTAGERLRSDCDFDTKELIYRERTTRIRQLRQYLTTKIKLKKIGDYYREEISLQVQLDLKRASENLNKFESTLHDMTRTWRETLRQLPKHRFKEVMSEEKISETSQTIQLLIENNLAGEAERFLSDLDIIKRAKHIEREVLMEGNKALLKITNRENIWKILKVLECKGIKDGELDEAIIEVLRKYLTDYRLSKKEKETLITDDNIEHYQNKTCDFIMQQVRFKENEEEKLAESISPMKQQFQERDTVTKLTNTLGTVRTRLGLTTNDQKRIPLDDVISTMIPLYLDRNAMIADAKKIAKPFLRFVIKKSSELAIFTVDKSFFATTDIVSTLASYLTTSAKDFDKILGEQQENIFFVMIMKSIPDICKTDMDRIALLWHAFCKRKKVKAMLLREVEGKLSSTLLRDGTRFVDDIGERFLSDFLQNIFSRLSISN
jgi:hypothetical protein